MDRKRVSNMQDTIAAIATSLGVGAISIIRVSGPDAISIVDKIATSNLLNKKSHTINYSYIKDGEDLVDEVLISIMKAPKTFTKEDVVEINCHGGIATTKKVLELLLKNGARLAEPGEFTKRAFLNGRIDLTEASAVMDLIKVSSEEGIKLAMANLKGSTKEKIRLLRAKIIDIISNIEVNIDFPEYQDIEVVTTQKIKDLLEPLKKDLQEIITNSKNSKVIKDGINVAIIGRPNVGKSSILNKLLGEEKAIVTDIPGTTRDLVEASIYFDGLRLNLMDTAGIRKTSDQVEKIGVEKSIQSIEAADLILLVLNQNEALTKEDYELLDLTKDKKRIFVLNKNDLPKKIVLPNVEEDFNLVTTSTISSDGLKELTAMIKKMFDLNKIKTKDFTYVSNLEQLNRLEEANSLLSSIEKGLDNNLPIDMLEIDLKEIFQILGEIIGETYTEELLDHIFKNFCVGK